jgi:hypothetical protein
MRRRPGLAIPEHFVILGASLESGAFGGGSNSQTPQVISAQQRIATLTGKTVTIHSYAVDGQNIDGMIANSLPLALALLNTLPGEGRTVVLIGSGGNTVSENRPLSPAVLADSKAKLLGVIAQIEAKDADWCLFDLSWRDYAPPLCRYDRSQGSWPFVSDVSRVINAARAKLYARNWVHPNGASWCDMYSFIRNNRQHLQADGVHLSDATITRNFIIDTAMVPAITGVAPVLRVPRDETYPLTFTSEGVAVTTAAITVTTKASHQGVAHLGIYAAGSTPSAADVIAGTGTGFVSKVFAERNGATIDANVTLAVTGLTAGTAYRACSVFVSDAQQTSAVVGANVSTEAVVPPPTVSDSPVVILLRGNATIDNPRPNLNLINGTDAATMATANGVKLSNAVNLAGENTGIGLTVTAPFAGGLPAGVYAATVPDYFVRTDELKGTWYVDSMKAAISLTGLNPARTYRLVFAASRDVTPGATDRKGDLAITAGTVTSGAASQVLDGAPPLTGTTANHVIFTVQPTAGGVISFTQSRIGHPTATSGLAYLNGIHITPV